MRRRLVWLQGAEECGPNRTLAAGGLSLTIDSNTGAISQILFGGRDWYNPGVPVSDYVFALGGTVWHWYLQGGSGTTRVCGSPSKLSVDNYAEVPIPVKRVYTLNGDNAFIVKTSFTNTTESPLLIEFAETFDPDQDWDLNESFDTKNRIVSIGGISATRATGVASTYTVIMGSPNVESVVDASGPNGGYFRIDSLPYLQNFLSNPHDAQDAQEDMGIHCGFRKTLDVGETYTFTMLQGFGVTIGSAESAFIAALATVS